MKSVYLLRWRTKNMLGPGTWFFCDWLRGKCTEAEMALKGVDAHLYGPVDVPIDTPTKD
jgi:hypothetical protein